MLIPQIAERLHLSAVTTETIRFLVEHHLLLADTALRRDLNDEELIIRCAQIIQDPGRLKMLYLLTYADSLATGFRAWNNWKSMLIRELFFKLLRVLEQGEMATGQAQETLKSARLEILRLIGSEMTGQGSPGSFGGHAGHLPPFRPPGKSGPAS